MTRRTKRRKQLSPNDWQGHLDRWEKSGQSQATYCRRNKLHPATFSRQVGLSRVKDEPQGLVQIPVVPPAPRMIEFQVRTRPGQDIKLQIDLSDAQTVTWRLSR